MAATNYIATINLSDTSRKRIDAGTPFAKDRLHQHTFDELFSQKYIMELTGSPQTMVDPVLPGRSLGGPPNKTARAALAPPTTPEIEAEVDEKRKVIFAKLKKLGVQAAHNCSLSTLEKKLAKATDPTKNSAVSDRIWNYDPADLKDVELPRLTATYIERCKKFKIDPDDLATVEALIEKLTSQFGN